jgi:N6-L-threonylcarbamoyladenine synthase
MKVLGIESSCDETAAAVVKEGSEILSSVVASQVPTHSPYGGVVPELASREHVDNISFIAEQSLKEADLDWSDLGALAVTRGPGLVGALLVGLAFAKAVAYARHLPFLGINHLEGHIYSVFMDHPLAETPALCLVVSGGHTNLYYLREKGDYELIARSRDDAAGEALDKLSKYLGLGYPGGPIIEKLAPRGDSTGVPFRVPKITDRSLDFSFSGIKTAALRHLQAEKIQPLQFNSKEIESDLPQFVYDLLASFQKAIIEQLVDRTRRALQHREVRSIQISGGVSCNRQIRKELTDYFGARELPVYYPKPALTTDNAAMIAGAAYHRLKAGQTDGWDLQADPNLRI